MLHRTSKDIEDGGGGGGGDKQKNNNDGPLVVMSHGCAININIDDGGATTTMYEFNNKTIGATIKNYNIV